MSGKPGYNNKRHSRFPHWGAATVARLGSVTSRVQHAEHVDLNDLDRFMAVVGDDRATSSLSFDTRSREHAAEMLDGILGRAKREPHTGYYPVARNELGMSYEGRIRDHVYTNGQWRDSLLCSVLTDEWVTATLNPHCRQAGEKL